MDQGFIIFFFLIVVGLPVAGKYYSEFHKRNMAFKEKQLEAVSSETAEKAAQYAAKSERLEQRVAVLERILTDRSAHLADEIDALKDTNVN